MSRCMIISTKALFLAVAVAVVGAASAQGTLYKVVDRFGNVTYQDQPPIDDTGVNTETLSISEGDGLPAEDATPESTADIEAAVASRPLVLFTVPECDSCDFVRWALQERDLPFEEVDVRSGIENQQRLQEATGEFRVPVLMVGEQPLFGYDRAALMSELAAAGYIDREVEPATDEPGVIEDAEVVPPAPD
jgi:glutaredoxin